MPLFDVTVHRLALLDPEPPRNDCTPLLLPTHPRTLVAGDVFLFNGSEQIVLDTYHHPISEDVSVITRNATFRFNVASPLVNVVL